LIHWLFAIFTVFRFGIQEDFFLITKTFGQNLWIVASQVLENLQSTSPFMRLPTGKNMA